MIKQLPTTLELHCPGCGARTNFYPFVDNELPVVCNFCKKIITKTIVRDLIVSANIKRHGKSINGNQTEKRI